MAITATALKRVFMYGGVELPDPSEAMTAEEVRDLYSASYPEIMSAVIDGPKVKGETLVFEFVRAVKDKG